MERYANGFAQDRMFEIGSIRKSFNSALMGSGAQECLVDLDARGVDWWPELVEISGEPEDEAITLHQLASGVSGWLTPDAPGTTFYYNNAAFTAAERVVARMLRLPNDEIAPEVERRFKNPLGVHWRIYHFQRPFSGTSGNPGPKLALDSTLRELALWGQVWIEGGSLGGAPIIPREHVTRATQPVNPRIENARYGYNWFLNADGALWPEAPRDAYGHPGNGSFRPSGDPSHSYLWVCPSLAAVAVVIMDASAGLNRDYRRAPQGLVAEWVRRLVAALGGEQAGGASSTK